MLVLIGYIVAFGCIFGMYVLHGGSVGVLVKALPFEMVTIGGGAWALSSSATSPRCSRPRPRRFPRRSSPRAIPRRAIWNDGAAVRAAAEGRKEGLMSIESDVEDPQSSTVFQNYPS
jgi:chemotaxis protein MotA